MTCPHYFEKNILVRQSVVADHVLGVELVGAVDEVGAEVVDDGDEGEAVAERGRQVCGQSSQLD